MDNQDPPTGGPAKANAIDVHVGARVRIRRKALGISQERLANELGLTFQQVQKYERGSNRISASKLYETARVLGVEPDYFFTGLPDPQATAAAEGGNPDEQTVQAFLITAEGPALGRVVSSMKAPTRTRVLNLLWALTSPEAAV
jgi:transcriptional regulator with XRE-family HTH domain